MTELLNGYISEDDYLQARRFGRRQAQRERAARTGPPFVKLGRDVYYRVDGFRAWLAAQEIKPVKGRAR